MKKVTRVFLFVMALTALLISACGGAATATSAGSGKGQASLVEFTGVIEAMDGNQWTIGGQVITVDPSVLRDGPFIVGDTVKVEFEVQADGSMVVTRVEAPVAVVNSNDANGNSGNSNEDNSNGGLAFDAGGTEAFGTVDSITVDTVVIGGQTFTIANDAEFKDQILPGDFVKVHFSLNADGTLSMTEIETWDPALVSDDNTNDDNGNDDNSNDDNGNDDNSNDDNGNDDNSNDDNGNGNSNDDIGNDDNGNDDNSNGNSNGG
ncbi:MAG: DUF5666 domain-containing protein [Anaerolineales bacterium]|nr:DUF5666 domain-containing protein [Anaerolineales bacterium]